MEGYNNAEQPLLYSSLSNEQVLMDEGEVWRQRYSCSRMKNDFLAELPDKVRPALDVESPFDVDFSRTSHLIALKLLIISSHSLLCFKSFEEVDSLELPLDEEMKEETQHERAMNISNAANVLLLAFKGFWCLLKLWSN